MMIWLPNTSEATLMIIGKAQICHELMIQLNHTNQNKVICISYNKYAVENDITNMQLRMTNLPSNRKIHEVTYVYLTWGTKALIVRRCTQMIIDK